MKQTSFICRPICVLYHLVLCFIILLCLCNPAFNAAILNEPLIDWLIDWLIDHWSYRNASCLGNSLFVVLRVNFHHDAGFSSIVWSHVASDSKTVLAVTRPAAVVRMLSSVASSVRSSLDLTVCRPPTPKCHRRRRLMSTVLAVARRLSIRRNTR